MHGLDIKLLSHSGAVWPWPSYFPTFSFIPVCKLVRTMPTSQVVSKITLNVSQRLVQSLKLVHFPQDMGERVKGIDVRGRHGQLRDRDGFCAHAPGPLPVTVRVICFILNSSCPRSTQNLSFANLWSSHVGWPLHHGTWLISMNGSGWWCRTTSLLFLHLPHQEDVMIQGNAIGKKLFKTVVLFSYKRILLMWTLWK